MRMGVYQILYMDAVADAVAVNESVRLAGQKHLNGLKGFVNAVLRQIVRNKDSLPWPKEGTDISSKAAYLSVMESEPYWLCKDWILRFGYDRTQTMMKSFLTVRPNVLRVNLTVPRQELAMTFAGLKKMAAEGKIAVRQSPVIPYAIELKDSGSIRRLPGFKEGHWMVQDTSSMLVAHVAGLKPGQTVMDVCAAPGGKAIHAAEIMKHTGKVVACDISVNKCMKIKENIARLHAGGVVTVEQWDALRHNKAWDDTADCIFIDAPCSGLGVIGRKPDIKMNVLPATIMELQKQQRDIFANVWNYVKPGGTIIYSTCTISEAENEENVRWFLRNYPVDAVSIRESLPPKLANEPDAGNGMLQLLPGIHGTDGFFIAKLRRRT